MRASVYLGQHRLGIQDADVPVLESGDLLLKVKSCGVCGTDVRKVVFDLPQPQTILGHEVCGEVVDVGKTVEKFSIGDRIVVAHHVPCFSCHYCLHGNVSMCATFKSSNLDPGGFAEYTRVSSRHVTSTAHKIPDDLSYDEAIFMEPLACALRNVRRSNILPGDTAWVVGLGNMGLMSAALLADRGVRVVGSDFKEDRRRLGLQTFGLSDAFDPSDSVAQKQALMDATDGRGVDLVILTAGNAQSYADSLKGVRNGGSVSIFAGLDPKATLNLSVEDLYHREITLYSSYSPSPEDLYASLQLLAFKKVPVAAFAPQAYGLDKLSDAIEEVKAQKHLKATIHPELLNSTSAQT